MIDKLGEGDLKSPGMLAIVFIRGGRSLIWVVDRDTRFVRWEKVPVSSDQKSSTGGGTFRMANIFFKHFRKLRGLGSREPMIVHIPDLQRRFGGARGGKGNLEGTSREETFIADGEVFWLGARSFTDESHDTSFSGVVGKGGEEVEFF